MSVSQVALPALSPRTTAPAPAFVDPDRLRILRLQREAVRRSLGR